MEWAACRANQRLGTERGSSETRISRLSHMLQTLNEMSSGAKNILKHQLNLTNLQFFFTFLYNVSAHKC